MMKMVMSPGEVFRARREAMFFLSNGVRTDDLLTFVTSFIVGPDMDVLSLLFLTGGGRLVVDGFYDDEHLEQHFSQRYERP